MEGLIGILVCVVFVGILIIHHYLSNIRIELRYRNTLMDEQNKILKDKL